MWLVSLPLNPLPCVLRTYFQNYLKPLFTLANWTYYSAAALVTFATFRDFPELCKSQTSGPQRSALKLADGDGSVLRCRAITQKYRDECHKYSNGVLQRRYSRLWDWERQSMCTSFYPGTVLGFSKSRGYLYRHPFHHQVSEWFRNLGKIVISGNVSWRNEQDKLWRQLVTSESARQEKSPCTSDMISSVY